MDASDSSPTLDDLLAHGGWARGLARGLLADEGEAEDALQEAWLAALRRPPESPGAERSWLRRVLTNAVNQRARGEAARGARERRVARPEAVPSTSDLVEQVEHQRILHEEVLALEEPWRSVVILRYLREMDAAAIARLQGVPAGTVRSHLKRGLERLRERLDRRFGGVRAAWALPLAATLEAPPLPLPAPAPTSPGPSPLLAGALAMQTSTKLVLSLMAATVVGVSWLALERSATPQAGERQPVARPEPMVREPAPAAAELVRTAPETTQVTRQATPEVVREEPVLEELPAAEPAPRPIEPAGVVVHFVGPDGGPLAGVRAVVVSDAEEAGSDAWELDAQPSGHDGVVRLGVPLESPANDFVLVYTAVGFARGARNCWLESGKTLELGTIALEREGLVVGHVVDPDGRPVPDAWVWTLPTPLPKLDDGQLARIGPDVDRPSASARQTLRVMSDETGAFTLANVPAGELHVWGHKEGWRYGYSEPIALQPGTSVYDVLLRLEPLRPTDRIAGRVLRPDGQPLADTRMGFEMQTEGYGFSSSVMLDDDGRFDLLLQRDVPHTFTVEGKGLEWSTERVDGVEPGTRDLLIRLRKPRAVELVVRDPDDRPVDPFAYEIVSDPDGPTGYRRSEPQKGGSAWIPVPAERFEVEVAAAGFALGRLGPYDPDAVPGELTLTLQPLPGIRGTVLAGGKPVAGAKVSLHPAVERGSQYSVNGFLARMRSEAESTRSEEDGSFLLTGRLAGTFYLRVTAKGFALAELGPFQHTPGAGSRGHVLRLDEGGTLEVQARVPEGESPAGVLVGLSRGDGLARTLRTDAHGWLRVEGLTAGPWYVKVAAQEIHPNQVTSTYSEGDEDLPSEPEYNCDVVAGRTSYFTLVVGE